jgi:hypothetical protein
MIRTRIFPVCAATLVPYLALAGCGGTESPNSEPSPSTSVSTPGPTSSAPTNPTTGVPGPTGAVNPTPTTAGPSGPVSPVPSSTGPSGPVNPVPTGSPSGSTDVPSPFPTSTDETLTSGPDETSTDDETPVGGGSAAWGEVENPSADCDVPEPPAANSLTERSAKLPDPFKKMNGERITAKSEWKCRRQELLKQAYAYIYGEKPVPPKDAVTGTVSNSSITVEVNDGGKSARFNVSVNMNGATAPAPAIIVYGGFGGPPIPSGVATITFNASETQGGSGAKSGPFYDVYGGNHPAGYLAAQAWQVSRIIDVLEQHPDVIDPSKIGVTGCSRLGKGAFVAGVLDNRIALTIPVESGLGGTVGLRLVETLDNYNGAEWAYHGISYVRWLSEVALSPFASGNNANEDNTDRLPIDMHEMMGLIAPRGLYIVDNPSGTYNGLDRNSAWVTANVGKKIFEALGVGDHMTYQGASGEHCQWRSAYTEKLNAMVDKFLKGNTSAQTGGFATDLGNPPNPESHYEWDVPTLSGDL